MKRIIKITSFFLIVILVMILSGCKNTNESYKIGQWQENIFISEWLGLKFSLPEGWYIATSDQMSNIIDENSGAVFVEEQAAEIDYDKANIIYEFIISEDSIDSENQMKHIIFMSEKLSSMQGNIKDEKDYLSEIKKQLINTQGLEASFGITRKKEIEGKTFYYADSTVTASNIASIAQRYYCLVKDGYASLFIVSTLEENPESGFLNFESRFTSILDTSELK